MKASPKKRYVQAVLNQKHAPTWQNDGRTQLTGFLATNDVYGATEKIRGDSITLDGS